MTFISILSSLAMASVSPVVAVPPPGLQFGFWRMASFRARAREFKCGAGDLDAQLEAIRKQLAGRYGKKEFEWPKIPKSPPSMGGDCRSIVMVYRVNLGDFRREAAAVHNGISVK